MRPRRLLLAALLVAILEWPASATQSEGFNTRFVAIAFHDVVDPGQPADVDSVSVDRLVTFFDWLKEDGWTVITSSDIDAARSGRKALPAKAILLSFDDGYASFYSRVYPLLLAYRYPAVLALVGEWMDQPPGSKVEYGSTLVPREHFLTWEQVRRMRASGLVEVASHSYDLHQVVPINLQGSTAGAGRSWLYDRRSGTAETDAAHRSRIRADLIRSRDVIKRETGSVPHILVWPFGRYSGLALEEAKAAGFDQMLTLETAMADARQPLEIPRYYPTRDPDLGTIRDNLKFEPTASPTLRAACVDLAPLGAVHGPSEQDELLGRTIEELRRLGANIAIVDALIIDPANLRPIASLVPTDLLPVRADILSRAARQLSSRADVDVYVRLPLGAVVRAFGMTGAAQLAQMIARAAPITGLALDGGDAAGHVMRSALLIDPQLRLMIDSDRSEADRWLDDADLVLLPPAAHHRTAGRSGEKTAGDILFEVPHTGAKEQVKSIRAMQAEGATGLALCPWNPLDSDTLAPAFSASIFPRKP